MKSETQAVDGAVPARLEHVGLFWSASGMPGPTAPFRGAGSDVAANDLVRALAQHARLSSLDLCVPLSELDSCRQQFLGLPPEVYGGRDAVTQVIPHSHLPERLAAHNYDVLHDTGSDLVRPSYVRARLSRRLFPITCSQHAISYSFVLYDCFIPMLSVQLYPCDAVVCLSRDAREAMENCLGDVAERFARVWERPAPSLPRLEIIPFGVDAERFAPQDAESARRLLDLPPDRPVVLCVGRLRIHDKMDWTPLLLAFQRVAEAVRPRPLLALAGSTASEYASYLLNQAGQLGIREDVCTFFNLPPACLPTLYAACDVFVSPSDSPSESQGLTIIEAMACGRAVVASDWDGYKDAIVQGETGFRVRTDWADCLGRLNTVAPVVAWDQQHLHLGQSVSVDVGQMAEYLRLLLENQELRETMGHKGRERVAALYDWPVIVRRWEALWTELGAIARTLEKAPSPRLDHLTPNYFEHFGHYASRIIDEDTPVRITERGREVLAGKEPLFLHPWTRGFLEPETMRVILGALRPAGWLGTGLPMGKLVAAVERGQSLDRDVALMHLMWLAKYDLVSLAGDAPCIL